MLRALAILLTCQLVGGKNSLPWSHSIVPSSASAGITMWIGFFASCG